MNKAVIYLSKILRNELYKPLGRWKLDYCDIKINNRVDLSNEDHCGTCGQYAKIKLDTKNNFLLSSDKNTINPEYPVLFYPDILEMECIEELKK